MSKQPPLPLYYELRTISDFVALPPDKIGPCLMDFAEWLRVVYVATHLPPEAGVRVNTPIDVFGWVDDGKHVMTLTVTDGKETHRLDREFAPPEQP